MFEDIIGEIRRIEIRYADGTWRLSRIKDLKACFVFRYIDSPETIWRAVADPCRNEDGGWGVIGSPDEYYV